MINLNKYFYRITEFSPFGCRFLLGMTGFTAFAVYLDKLVNNVLLAYSTDLSWLIALRSMFVAVT